MNTGKNKKFFDKFLLRLVIITFIIFSVMGTIMMYSINSETTETVIPDHSSYFYINDYSGVYSSNTEAFIYNQGIKLEKSAKGAQISIAAVPDTGDLSLEDYSNRLANQWGIGDKSEDNGILILFTTEEPHVRIEVGYGLEGCLPDAKCGRILDKYAVQDINSGNWNRAAVNTWIAVAKEIYNEYGMELPSDMNIQNISESGETGNIADLEFPELIITKNKNPIPIQILFAFFAFWGIFFLPYLLLIFWIQMFRIFPNKGSGRYYGGGGFGGGFGGGGFGGGISGGGGSFGGGGAGR